MRDKLEVGDTSCMCGGDAGHEWWTVGSGVGVEVDAGREVVDGGESGEREFAGGLR